MATKSQENDHDLLVRVDEKLNGLGKTVGEMRDNNTKQLADHEHRLRTLESDYVSKATYDSAHAALIKSIDGMKKIIYMAMGGWILLTIIAGLIARFYGK